MANHEHKHLKHPTLKELGAEDHPESRRRSPLQAFCRRPLGAPASHLIWLQMTLRGCSKLVPRTTRAVSGKIPVACCTTVLPMGKTLTDSRQGCSELPSKTTRLVGGRIPDRNSAAARGNTPVGNTLFANDSNHAVSPTLTTS